MVSQLVKHVLPILILTLYAIELFALHARFLPVVNRRSSLSTTREKLNTKFVIFVKRTWI